MLSARKILLAVAFSLVLLFQTTFPVSAQTTTSSYIQTEPNVPHDTTTLVQSLVAGFLTSATCMTAGINLTIPSRPCLGVNPKTGLIGYTQSNGGLLGITTKLIAVTINIPVHSVMFTDYLAHSFHVFGEKTYAASSAQGLGYAGLSPLINIWIGFRNVAYLMLVIVFIVIGFAVMLRLKIDPRTVMSIQNQLPKIIIGIILVTFSFAIAALLVDLMYVITYLIISVVGTAAGDTALLQTNPIGQNPWGLSFNFFAGGFFGVAAGVAAAVGQMAAEIIANIPFIGGALFAVGIVTNPTQLFCGLPAIGNHLPFCNMNYGAYEAATMVGDLAGLVVIIAVIIALWKLWLALLKAYLFILFNATLGPLLIIAGAIPGVKLGVGYWLRGLIANLLVFPTVIGVFVLGREFALAFGGYSYIPDPNKAGYFIPPAIGNLGNTGGLAGIIAFAVLMLLPVIPDTVIKALKAESPLGQAVGQGIATGIAFPAKGFKAARQHLFRAPDIYRRTGPGEGLRLMLGGNPKGWRWRTWMKMMGYNSEEARKQISPLIKEEPPASTVANKAQGSRGE